MLEDDDNIYESPFAIEVVRVLKIIEKYGLDHPKDVDVALEAIVESYKAEVSKFDDKIKIGQLNTIIENLKSEVNRLKKLPAEQG